MDTTDALDTTEVSEITEVSEVTDATDAQDVNDADVPPPEEGVLIISEVVQADFFGRGLPKWIELTNVGNAAIDLSEYSIGMFNDGVYDLSTIDLLHTATAFELHGTLSACMSYVINFHLAGTEGAGDFYDAYGVDPAIHYESDQLNGNDAVALFLGYPLEPSGTDAVLIDIYGVIGEAGGDWLYTNGVGYRLPSVTEPVVEGCSGVDLEDCGWVGGQWYNTTGILGTALGGYTTPLDHDVETCP